MTTATLSLYAHHNMKVIKVSADQACQILDPLEKKVAALARSLGAEPAEDLDGPDEESPRYKAWARTRGAVSKTNDKKSRRVPRRLHNTTTGHVELMEPPTLREGVRLSYATVSHVWAETENKKWETVAREIGRLLGVDYAWVDKSCIVQTDASEKDEELPKMAQYYMEADVNVIVLGDDMSMAEAVDQWIGEGRPVGTQSHTTALKRLSQLFKTGKRNNTSSSSEYFRRVWTLQEFELARYHVVLAADGLVEGEDLDMLLRTAGMRAVRFALCEPGFDQEFEDATMHFFNNTIIRAHVDDQAWAEDMRRPLLEVWRLAMDRKCEDPRDIVWGVLSLIKGGEKLAAKYSDPLHEVLAELLQKKSNLGDILAINSSRTAGMIPLAPGREYSGRRFPSSLIDGKIEMEAFELFASEGARFQSMEFSLSEGQPPVKSWPRIGLKDHERPDSLRGAQRYWGVPLWRLANSSTSRGVVVTDGNSEGVEVQKINSLCFFDLCEMSSSGTTIQISGWAKGICMCRLCCG